MQARAQLTDEEQTNEVGAYAMLQQVLAASNPLRSSHGAVLVPEGVPTTAAALEASDAIVALHHASWVVPLGHDLLTHLQAAPSLSELNAILDRLTIT